MPKNKRVSFCLYHIIDASKIIFKADSELGKKLNSDIVPIISPNEFVKTRNPSSNSDKSNAVEANTVTSLNMYFIAT